MNTEILTTPSPELKQHVQELRRNAGNVTQDLKNQASAGFQEVKTEAQARLHNVRGTAFDLYDSARGFAVKHPFKAIGIGVLAGFALASWRRK